MDPQLCCFFDASLQLLLQFFRGTGRGPTWCLRREVFCVHSRSQHHSLGEGRVRELVLHSLELPPTSLGHSGNYRCFPTRCAPPTTAGSAQHIRLQAGRRLLFADFCSNICSQAAAVSTPPSLFALWLLLREVLSNAHPRAVLIVPTPEKHPGLESGLWSLTILGLNLGKQLTYLQPFCTHPAILFFSFSTVSINCL